MSSEEFEIRVRELSKRLATFDFFIFRETDSRNREVLEGIGERVDLVHADVESSDNTADHPKITFWLNFLLVGPSPKPYLKKILAYQGTGQILKLHAQGSSNITLFKVAETDETTMEIIGPLREARALAGEEHSQVTANLIKEAQAKIRNGEAL